MSATILCRFGELFLKGGNRPRFERALADNLRAALDGLPDAKVTTPHARLVATVREADVEEACARAARVFGLVSISPTRTVAPQMEAMGEAAVGAARAALASDPTLGKSFRIEARRSDKRFPLNSPEIGREIGGRVAAATGLPVDLERPTLTIGVEVATDAAHIYWETRPAPGGLPVGMSGRGMLLLSGGIDSPVAGWLAAKRGLQLDAVYFHSPPFVGEKSRDKVLSLARELHRWGALRSVFVAPFTDCQKRLREAAPGELAVVMYRRMMMRVADLLADRVSANCLVTGENLGQVASQTIPNMTVIEGAARRLVLRPLVTYDKMETTALARRIGTFDISALPYDDCCSLFVPAHPATAARLVDAERAEQGLDITAEAAAVAGAAEEIRL